MTEPKPQKTYHHGDLRRAILDAGEAELASNGLHGFSLRKVAARVGVSHTAPSHHFGGVSGLIEALAVRGFEQLLASMEAHQARAEQTPYEQLIASGLGYLTFAFTSPALFRLIFGLPNKPQADSALHVAGAQAFEHIAMAVAAVNRHDDLDHCELQLDVMACWTRVHGIAELALAGFFDMPENSDGTADMDATFRRLFEATFLRD